MKKLIFAIFVISLFPVFAELHPARRYIEVGASADFMAAQNVMPLTEIFKKNLVIDLKKIRSQMSPSGATLTVGDRECFYVDANFKKFGFGVNVASEFGANFNISKDLFKVLDSIVPGTVYEADASVWLESFFTVSVPVRFNVDKWKIKITPTYFVPMLYVPATTVKGRAVNGVDGSITASAQAPIVFYTVSEFKGLIKNGDFSTDFTKELDAKSLSSDMAKSGGVDLSAEVEYALKENFDIGGYITTPLVPGRMKHKVSALATLSVRSDSLMRMMFDDESADSKAELSDAVYSGADYIVNRPLRLGAECAWRPVGNWLTLRAKAGVALRNPFGADFGVKSFYPEYKLGVDIVGIGMFGLGLNSQYTKKVFAHGIDIMLNFRAIEFDISAAVCSPSLVQSFKGEGVTAAFGVKLGW